VLQQVGLVLLRLDKSLVAIGRPGAGKYMQETQSALSILIQEMSNNILILLGLFNREERLLDPFCAAIVLILVLFIPAFKRGKL
jgi:hypothetical protein